MFIVGFEKMAASGARGMRKKPLINASNMKTVTALWEEPNLVSIREVCQANCTI